MSLSLCASRAHSTEGAALQPDLQYSTVLYCRLTRTRAPVSDPTAAVDALKAANGDIAVTIHVAPPWPPSISTVRADPASFRAAIEEKVRRLEAISPKEAKLYGETLTDEEQFKAFPNGWYKCAPVGFGCPVTLAVPIGWGRAIL